MSTGVWRIAAASVATVISLAGCSADDGPGPTVLASRTASARPSPSAPAAPSALTPQGAADFARYFFDVVETAYLTGSTATLKSLSTPECVACSRYVQSIESVYGHGGKFVGGDFNIRFAEAPAFEGAKSTVSVLVDITRTDELAADGAVVKSDPPQSRVEGNLDLTKSTGSWRVLEFSVVAK